MSSTGPVRRTDADALSTQHASLPRRKATRDEENFIPPTHAIHSIRVKDPTDTTHHRARNPTAPTSPSAGPPATKTMQPQVRASNPNVGQGGWRGFPASRPTIFRQVPEAWAGVAPLAALPAAVEPAFVGPSPRNTPVI